MSDRLFVVEPTPDEIEALREVHYAAAHHNRNVPTSALDPDALAALLAAGLLAAVDEVRITRAGVRALTDLENQP